MSNIVKHYVLCTALVLSTPLLAAQKRDLDFERLNGQWNDPVRGVSAQDRDLAPALANEVEQTFSEWQAAQNKADRAQFALLVELKIAIFYAGVALAKEEKRLAALSLELRDLQVEQARLEAQAAQLQADRLALQNVLQQEANERALRDAEERQRQQEQDAEIARQEAQLSRELASAQAREAELARKEAELRGDQVEALRRQIAGMRELSTARGKALILGDAFFSSGQGELSAGGKKGLDTVLRFLDKYPGLPVSIEGHSDSRGSEAANQKISQKRAESVRATLIALGADAERIKAKGFGEAQPIASNDTDSGRARNRRVEIVIEGAK